MSNAVASAFSRCCLSFAPMWNDIPVGYRCIHIDVLLARTFLHGICGQRNSSPEHFSMMASTTGSETTRTNSSPWHLPATNIMHVASIHVSTLTFKNPPWSSTASLIPFTWPKETPAPCDTQVDSNPSIKRVERVRYKNHPKMADTSRRSRSNGFYKSDSLKSLG